VTDPYERNRREALRNRHDGRDGRDEDSVLGPLRREQRDAEAQAERATQPDENGPVALPDLAP
jgi:hypothetical protein